MERAFRYLKSVDLQVRPLHHRREDRVRAHVLLCMLAYYVEWHLRRALPRCCSTTTTPPPPTVSALRSSPLNNARRRRGPKPVANAPTTRCPCTASGPARRPRHPDRQHDAGGRGRQHFHSAHRTDTGAATLLRATGGDTARVASIDIP